MSSSDISRLDKASLTARYRRSYQFFRGRLTTAMQPTVEPAFSATKKPCRLGSVLERSLLTRGRCSMLPKDSLRIRMRTSSSPARKFLTKAPPTLSWEFLLNQPEIDYAELYSPQKPALPALCQSEFISPVPRVLFLSRGLSVVRVACGQFL